MLDTIILALTLTLPPSIQFVAYEHVERAPRIVVEQIATRAPVQWSPSTRSLRAKDLALLTRP